jgi:hypothetical protein
MSDLEDVISLAEAAEQLGLAQVTLRSQAAAGRIRAKLVGKTWITTRGEVERYRREVLGRIGRPPGVVETRPRATLLATVPWVTHRHPEGEVRLIGFDDGAADAIDAVVDVVRDAIAAGAQDIGNVVFALRHDKRSAGVYATRQSPNTIGIARDESKVFLVKDSDVERPG